MEDNTLVAHVREPGKKANKELRKKELTPAVYYTGQRQVQHIAINTHDFVKMLIREVPLFNLMVDGEALPCVVREIQRDPVTERVLHVDFFAVERGQKVKVTVPIHVIGTPEGVKQGGILEHTYREANIECIPRHIPAHFDVDVSQLEIGDSIHLEDLSFENIELLDTPNTVIAHVIPPRLEKEVVEEAEVEEGEAEEPEVIKGRAEEEKEEDKEK